MHSARSVFLMGSKELGYGFIGLSFFLGFFLAQLGVSSSVLAQQAVCPVDLTFVVDNSNSMRGKAYPGSSERKIDEAFEAIRASLNHLDSVNKGISDPTHKARIGY